MSFIGPFVGLICVRAFCDINLDLFERMEMLVNLLCKICIKVDSKHIEFITTLVRLPSVYNAFNKAER